LIESKGGVNDNETSRDDGTGYNATQRKEVQRNSTQRETIRAGIGLGNILINWLTATYTNKYCIYICIGKGVFHGWGMALVVVENRYSNSEV
jgi:hypothetical protein